MEFQLPPQRHLHELSHFVHSLGIGSGLLFGVLSPFAFVPWQCSSCCLLPRPPSVFQCYPSSSKYVSPRQQRKLGHRQAQVGQVIAIQLFSFELFSSASSILFKLILFIKLYSGLWCFQQCLCKAQDL